MSSICYKNPFFPELQPQISISSHREVAPRSVAASRSRLVSSLLFSSLHFLMEICDLNTIMAEEENQNEMKEEVKDDIGDLAPFDPTKKKKKKKPVAQDLVEEESVDSLAEKTESLSVSDGLETSFTGLKKKKKKPAHTDLLTEEKENIGEDLDDIIGEDEEGEGIVLQQFPWEGSDRDYEYEELLGRVFNILRENNPELAGDRRRTVMRPPQVLREGTKKTVFVNFMDLCKTMHRQPEHVMTFLLAEMGTSGSLDGQQRLVVKGRFAPKNFEGILRRYINEYVICNGCKSPDTILSKENRLFFLRCEKISVVSKQTNSTAYLNFAFDNKDILYFEIFCEELPSNPPWNRIIIVREINEIVREITVQYWNPTIVAFTLPLRSMFRL
ncbi:Eukaryotic translation initiation factor 2 subunit beta [Sesamum angolense]|uniref:Eukaryotic translation initiation factor 2 subunit beta n=1 Tax=Sesamum angolense TaxID=2727404 RepID=A0AAE1X9C9_9LAMI|nr:Eukaryotic translation initiation factor 2 subunit beta [Sesamum angolense]